MGIQGRKICPFCCTADQGILIYLVGHAGFSELLAQLSILLHGETAVVYQHSSGSAVKHRLDLIYDRLL